MASHEMNSNDKAQIIQPEPKMETRTFKFVIACVVFAMVIAVVALIVSFIGISMKGSNDYYINTDGQSTSGSTADKIWTFQIGHYQSNTQYLDEASGTIKGYNVDLVNAVCQIANKNCELVYDIYGNCWDSEVGQTARGGFGLMARWYDACVGWTNTYARARTFLFSDDVEQAATNALWIKTGASFPNFPDLSNLKIGFNDGWQSDEHCLALYKDNPLLGFDRSDRNQVFHYVSEEDIKTALVNGEVDLFFGGKRSYNTDDERIELFWDAGANVCIRGGVAMMMQKDQIELAAWWNAGFNRIRSTSQYDDICSRLDTVHGDRPGFEKGEICIY